MTAMQANLNETKPVRATGVRGPQSKPFERTFRSLKALNKFVEAEAGNVEVTHITQAHTEDETPREALNRVVSEAIVNGSPVVEEVPHTPAGEVIDLTQTTPEGTGVIEPTTNVINLTDHLDPAKARETAARRDAEAAKEPKEPRGPGRLKQLFDEWNALVPTAEGLGLRVRALKSLHENVAAGEKRVAFLRAQIAEAEAAPEQAQA